ncbi:MAG: hypothetical protein RBU30_24075 [Polyangia bacterium]|jgi:hypothetical protein|nr:hypothetical protein [Polyangia bacterium]
MRAAIKAGKGAARALFTCPAAICLLLCACGDDSHGSNRNQNLNITIDPDCASVRLTHYTASAGGWCEFRRDLAVLPASVQSGLTLAIAEPWAGGSYQGAFGEACGECWEISTSWATEVVMVHDLCPIQGNPICAGGHFHFDLASEAAEALQGGGLDAASARRVPCPVTGNVHVSISDWNEWGYQRLAFVNHRVPIRSASIRATPDGSFIPFERSGGAWQVLDGPRPGDGDGFAYQIVSAQGQTIESANDLAFQDVTPGGPALVHDLGAQLDDLSPPEGVCEYLPPGDVYKDGWGGIDEVRWQPNPWGDTQVAETSAGCRNGSTSCLRVTRMGNWSGMHLYYWQGFPRTAFSSLSIFARTESASLELRSGPSHEGAVCGEQLVTVGAEGWTEITFDLAAACSEAPLLSSVTFQSGSAPVPLLLDDIQFSP